MTNIKLLILENNTEVIGNYQKTIDRLERDDNIFFKPYICTELDDALKKLDENDIDIAIIDLNLSHLGAENDEGNNAIREIKEKYRLPIYVISAEPEKLASDIKDLVTLHPKLGGKSTPEIFKEMHSFLQLEFIKYFSRDGHLEKLINNFYWNHLYKTINSWKEVESENKEDINKILSRHTVSCLNEQLYVNGNIGKFDQYHPGEMYIIPPIKDHYHTGDIILIGSNMHIILNPACDIVNKDKMEHYVLAKIYEATLIPKIKSKNESNQNIYINENLKQVNKLDRYHFLPKFNIIGKEYVIDFQCLSTIPIGDISEGSDFETYIKERESIIKKHQKIASISSPFLKDIIARFSNYYARQGQPNLL